MTSSNKLGCCSEDHIMMVVDEDSARRRSRSQSLKDCHVRFDSLIANKGDEVTLCPVWKGDQHVDVHLGFLQLYHKYDVTFTLEGPVRRLRPNQDPAKSNVTIHKITPNSQDESKLEINLQIYVASDKMFHEECTLINVDNPKKNVFLNVYAKVLSKDKGTPLLKRGIHCTEHYQDEEPEYLS
ncbi:hypothetical protein CHUAL_008766 [Chamberlinius hualienensis]